VPGAKIEWAGGGEERTHQFRSHDTAQDVADAASDTAADGSVAGPIFSVAGPIAPVARPIASVAGPTASIAGSTASVGALRPRLVGDSGTEKVTKLKWQSLEI
jgi:hypothetical protein